MADILKEQIYTVPLRTVKRAPRWKRSKTAMIDIRAYLVRHMKCEAEEVKLDPSINERIWERGSEKPPSRIRIRAMKMEDGIVQADLVEE
jgi:large subunit ribosomal protein L31e